MGVGAVFISTLALHKLPETRVPFQSQQDHISAALEPVVAFIVLSSVIVRECRLLLAFRFNCSRVVRWPLYSSLHPLPGCAPSRHFHGLRYCGHGEGRYPARRGTGFSGYEYHFHYSRSWPERWRRKCSSQERGYTSTQRVGVASRAVVPQRLYIPSLHFLPFALLPYANVCPQVSMVVLVLCLLLQLHRHTSFISTSHFFGVRCPPTARNARNKNSTASLRQCR